MTGWVWKAGMREVPRTVEWTLSQGTPRWSSFVTLSLFFRAEKVIRGDLQCVKIWISYL